MKYNPDKHHRQSIRLKNYDYASVGAYFVTICAYQREHLFGEVVKGEMKVNEIGSIVKNDWLKTSELRPNIILDDFVVMPNHVHLLFFVESREETRQQRMSRRGVLQYAPTIRSPTQTVGAIVRGYKGATTKRINELCNTPGTPIWQRNYHEHVIRNDEDCNRVRDYIQYNPQNWATDEENQ